jgi:hypothetical protein
MENDFDFDTAVQISSRKQAVEVGRQLAMPVIRITFTSTKDRRGQTIGKFTFECSDERHVTIRAAQVFSQKAVRSAVCEARGDVLERFSAETWEYVAQLIGEAAEEVVGAQ